MENKVRAGDVWWNTKDQYGKIYINVETSMRDVVRVYLMHNKLADKSDNLAWESGGLETVGHKLPEHWKFLYNLYDITTISLATLKDDDEEHST